MQHQAVFINKIIIKRKHLNIPFFPLMNVRHLNVKERLIKHTIQTKRDPSMNALEYQIQKPITV